MGKYLGLFVSEAGEHLEVLAADLVRLERAGREGGDTAPVVDGIMETAAALARLTSLWGRSRMRWSLV